MPDAAFCLHVNIIGSVCWFDNKSVWMLDFGTQAPSLPPSGGQRLKWVRLWRGADLPHQPSCAVVLHPETETRCVLSSNMSPTGTIFFTVTDRRWWRRSVCYRTFQGDRTPFSVTEFLNPAVFHHVLSGWKKHLVRSLGLNWFDWDRCCSCRGAFQFPVKHRLLRLLTDRRRDDGCRAELIRVLGENKGRTAKLRRKNHQTNTMMLCVPV